MELLEAAVRQQGINWYTADCVAKNVAAEVAWEKAKKNWLENAAICVAGKIPLPEKPLPAKVWKVILIDGTATEPTAYMAIAYGPEYVADPTLELPVLAPATGGVAKIGGLWWPGVWRVLPGDTKQAGQEVEHEGKTVVKTFSPPPFVSEYYAEKRT